MRVLHVAECIGGVDLKEIKKVVKVPVGVISLRDYGLFLYNHKIYKLLTAENQKKSLPYKSQGLAGRLTYAYMDRYFAEFNMGYTGSENFARGHRFGFFPAYAIGWMVSSEKWFEPLTKVVNDLKLKASYGKVGNDDIGASRRWAYEPSVNTVTGWSYGKTANQTGTGYRVGEIENTNVSWEEATKVNAGRGRRGRAWSTPKGTSIAMTFLLRPDVPIENVSRLTILSALATARALADTAGLQAQIKWPNDVVVGGKKICGILTEMSSEGMDIKYAVVGIGINVSMMEFPEELADKATSIKLENGTGCDRSKLVASVANHFEELYDAFVKCQDLQFMLDEYNSILVNKDEQVYVIEGYNRTEYTALGLAPNGGLRVKDKDGQESIIISGEVSVRGIYGYV